MSGASDHPAYRVTLQPQDIPAGRVTILRHRLGARVVHLDDGRAEQGFAIGFPAPVPDDSGVAHVLEHLVFRGSRLHPEDRLYTALCCNSLASHLNATTGPEMTAYHMASPLADDALRLQEALLAAVFHPLLTGAAFAQEAFDAATRTPGVVFNEMRGHLALPLPRAERALRRALYPDHPMGRCYGGDPLALSGLQPAQVRAFHRRHYHPAKALVLLSGGGDPSARLEQLHAALAAVSAGGTAAIPPPMPAAARGDGIAGWVLPDNLDHWQAMVLAELVMDSVGPAGLSPASGLAAGQHPHLALFGPAADKADPAALAAALTPAMVDRAAARLRARASDPEQDARLPAGLQIWPALCAAHLRGEDFEAVLDPIKPFETGILRDALAAMSAYDVRLVPAQTAPDLPATLPQPAAAVPLPAPVGHFGPLPLSQLPDDPPPPVTGQEQGIRLLPAAGPSLHIALWCRAAHLPDALRRHLPDLAASATAALGCTAASHHGAEAGLALGIRLAREDVAPWLASLTGWFTAPPVARSLPFAPPLAAEIRLRAALSPVWAQVGALVTAPPQAATAQDLQVLAQALGPHIRLATTQSAAVAPLARWRAQWAVAPDSPACPAPQPPQDAVVEAQGALFTLGLGLAAGSLPPLHAALVMRAIEAEYLWPRLRVAGGAYGIRATQAGDLLTIISLRDPQGPHSLALMRQAMGWLATQADAAMLHRAQLGVAGLVLQPRRLSAQLADLAHGGTLPATFPIDAIRQLGLGDLRQAALTLAMRDPVSLVQASGAELRAAGLG